MLSTLKSKYYATGAAISVGLMFSSADAHAGTNFQTMTTNLIAAFSNLPGIVSVISYIVGLVLVALGIMKVKGHVENPSNTPLKDGAIRLLAGGALLALPSIITAVTTMAGTAGTQPSAPNFGAATWTGGTGTGG